MIFFTATVLPLICTPGPDMLFVVSQAFREEHPLAYVLLQAFAWVIWFILLSSPLGVAAIIAASPICSRRCVGLVSRI